MPRFAVSVYPINFQTRSSRKLTREWKIILQYIQYIWNVILRYIFLLFFYKESACLFHLYKCTRDTQTSSSIYSLGGTNFSSRTFHSFISFHENMNSRAYPRSTDKQLRIESKRDDRRWKLRQKQAKGSWREGRQLSESREATYTREHRRNVPWNSFVPLSSVSSYIVYRQASCRM